MGIMYTIPLQVPYEPSLGPEREPRESSKSFSLPLWVQRDPIGYLKDSVLRVYDKGIY